MTATGVTAPGGPAAIRGVNHVTLAVADLGRAVAFYRDALGLRLAARWDEGAYLEAGSLWLCLALDPETSARGDCTHLALDVAPEDFAGLAERVRAAAPLWKENRSEGDSLYFLDPDGHRLEIHAGSLATRLDHYRARLAAGTAPPGLALEDVAPEAEGRSR